MDNGVGPDSTALKFLAVGVLGTTTVVLATPLTAGPSLMLSLIATITMLIIGRDTIQQSGQQTVRAWKVLLIVFGVWFCAELISTAMNGRHWGNLDYPSRFMIALGAFWIIRYARLRNADVFLYGLVASAIVASVFSVLQHYLLDMGRSQGWMNHPIYFGNISVLLAMYAAILLATMRSGLTARLRLALMIAIPLLVLAAIMSGSRSSWLGLAGLLVIIDWREVRYTRMILGLLVVAAGLLVTMTLFPELASSLRLTDATQDFRKILEGDYRSSIGDRLQMWTAALLMFLNSPVVGIGSGHYQAEAARLAVVGVVDLELINGSTVFNQAHSEIMDVLATKGLIGLAAYLVLLILPYRFFKEISETTVAEARTFALMGQATIVAFLMFGLTLATFKVQIYCAVFPVMIAVFAAMALNFAETIKHRGR